MAGCAGSRGYYSCTTGPRAKALDRCFIFIQVANSFDLGYIAFCCAVSCDSESIDRFACKFRAAAVTTIIYVCARLIQVIVMNNMHNAAS